MRFPSACGVALLLLAAPARAAGDVVIGAVHPLTGNAAQVGADARAALETEASIINGDADVPMLPGHGGGLAGLGGAHVRMVFADSQGRALITGPRLVDDSLAAVARIRDGGVTVLLVEQRLSEALAIADRAYVLQTGRVVMCGDAKVIAADAGVRRAYLGI